MSRLDLLWTIKFQNEKHEVETVSTISRLLLENILPKHVAEIIIKENMSQVGTGFTCIGDLSLLVFVFLGFIS